MTTDQLPPIPGPNMGAYAVALQRAIEHHVRGLMVPPEIAQKCPHHAKKLNDALTTARAKDAVPAAEPVAWLAPNMKEACSAADKRLWLMQNDMREIAEEHSIPCYLAAPPAQDVELLRALRQWDHLDDAADGPYWKERIDAAIRAAEGEN